MIEKDPKARVWAIPAPGGGSRAFCDRMNTWAQGEGQPGLGYIFWTRGRGAAAAGPVAQEHRAGARQARSATQLGLKDGDAVFFAAGNPENFYKFAGDARATGRPRTEAHRRGPLRAGLDRRLPDVRVERGREEDRLLAQPVLHAAGRARRTRSREEQRGHPRASRRSSTTSSATATSWPRAASATTCPKP